MPYKNKKDQTKWYEVNKDYISLYKKEYYIKNRDSICKKRRENYKNNKGGIKDKNRQYNKENSNKIRDRQFKKYFGLSLKEYTILKQQLFKEQNGCCKICGKSDSYYKKGLDLDHNHKTGQIRGLLCIVCNTRLAYLEDLEFVLKARAYLSEYNSI